MGTIISRRNKRRKDNYLVWHSRGRRFGSDQLLRKKIKKKKEEMFSDLPFFH